MNKKFFSLYMVFALASGQVQALGLSQYVLLQKPYKKESQVVTNWQMVELCSLGLLTASACFLSCRNVLSCNFINKLYQDHESYFDIQPESIVVDYTCSINGQYRQKISSTAARYPFKKYQKYFQDHIDVVIEGYSFCLNRWLGLTEKAYQRALVLKQEAPKFHEKYAYACVKEARRLYSQELSHFKLKQDVATLNITGSQRNLYMNHALRSYIDKIKFVHETMSYFDQNRLNQYLNFSAADAVILNDSKKLLDHYGLLNRVLADIELYEKATVSISELVKFLVQHGINMHSSLVIQHAYKVCNRSAYPLMDMISKIDEAYRILQKCSYTYGYIKYNDNDYSYFYEKSNAKRVLEEFLQSYKNIILSSNQFYQEKSIKLQAEQRALQEQRLRVEREKLRIEQQRLREELQRYAEMQ